MSFDYNIMPNTFLADLILSFSSAAAMLRLARVNKTLYFSVRSYIIHKYNINNHLSRFFPDPIAFRSLQARTASLVSGSNALQFFDRTFYEEADMDIYVYSHTRYEVGRFLLAAGYTFIPTNFRQDPQNEDFEEAARQSRLALPTRRYPIKGVSMILSFVKPGPYGKKLTVQMIVAVSTPVEVILGFHSTCVMNIISFEKAYSLYPWATFEDRISLINVSTSISHERAFEKYTARGWKMIREFPLEEQINPKHPIRIGSRWIDDASSWVIQLDLDGVQPPPPFNPYSPRMLQDPVSITNWQLRFDPHATSKIHRRIVVASVLAWAYVLTDEALIMGLRPRIWLKQLHEKEKDDKRVEMPCFFDAELREICKIIRQESFTV